MFFVVKKYGRERASSVLINNIIIVKRVISAHVTVDRSRTAIVSRIKTRDVVKR